MFALIAFLGIFFFYILAGILLLKKRNFTSFNRNIVVAYAFCMLLKIVSAIDFYYVTRATVLQQKADENYCAAKDSEQRLVINIVVGNLFTWLLQGIYYLLLFRIDLIIQTIKAETEQELYDNMDRVVKKTKILSLTYLIILLL